MADPFSTPELVLLDTLRIGCMLHAFALGTTALWTSFKYEALRSYFSWPWSMLTMVLMSVLIGVQIAMRIGQNLSAFLPLALLSLVFASLWMYRIVIFIAAPPGWHSKSERS